MSRYSSISNRMVRGYDLADVAAASPSVTLEVAGTTNGSSFRTENETTIVATLETTAISGSPTLDVKLQTSEDDSTWRDVAAFAQQTSVTSETKSFSGLGSYCRWVRVVAGTSTPKATYNITGVAK